MSDNVIRRFVKWLGLELPPPNDMTDPRDAKALVRLRREQKQSQDASARRIVTSVMNQHRSPEFDNVLLRLGRFSTEEDIDRERDKVRTYNFDPDQVVTEFYQRDEGRLVVYNNGVLVFVTLIDEVRDAKSGDFTVTCLCLGETGTGRTVTMARGELRSKIEVGLRDMRDAKLIPQIFSQKPWRREKLLSESHLTEKAYFKDFGDLVALVDNRKT